MLWKRFQNLPEKWLFVAKSLILFVFFTYGNVSIFYHYTTGLCICQYFTKNFLKNFFADLLKHRRQGENPTDGVVLFCFKALIKRFQRVPAPPFFIF